jgi:heme oxygenase
MMTDLAKQLKEGTKVSHSAAENTKFVASFLRGALNLTEYRKLITNFYYVYDTMEQRIRETEDPLVKQIHYPVLERKDAIEKDLEYYYGPEWRDQQIPSEACNQYCYRINELVDDTEYLLIAHHYTRYMGDLSGGQIFKGIVERVLQPPVGKGLNFYEFPEVPDATEFKVNYRATLDSMGVDQSKINALIAEANYAFRLNMYMFEELEGSAVKALLKVLCSFVKGKG